MIVSIDGLGSELIATIGLSNLPALQRLVTEGASTLNARTAVERTVTLPNHAGMLTGRPVNPDIGGHGVSVNADRGPTVQQLAGEPVASILQVSQGGSALFVAEKKLGIFARSWPRSIGRFEAFQDDDSAVMASAIADLTASRRALSFIHLGAVDKAGHQWGWLSDEQAVAAKKDDGLLADLMAAIAADRKLARRTVLIVTADHGGVRKSHADRRDPRNYTVPLLVWGRGVDAGADLYALNPQLTDPRRSQPAYAEKPPLRNACVANLVTSLLRLSRLRGSVHCRAGVQVRAAPASRR